MSGDFGDEFDGLAGVYKFDPAAVSPDGSCTPNAANAPLPHQVAEFKRLKAPHSIGPGKLDRLASHLCSVDRRATVLSTGQGSFFVVGDDSGIDKAALAHDIQQQQKPGVELQGPIVAMLPQAADGSYRPGSPLSGIEGTGSDGGEFNVGKEMPPLDYSAANEDVHNVQGVMVYRGVKIFAHDNTRPQEHNSLPSQQLSDAPDFSYFKTPLAEPGAEETVRSAIDAVRAGLTPASQALTPQFP